MENSTHPQPAGFWQRPAPVQVIRTEQASPVPARTIAPISDFQRFDQAKVHGAHAALTFVADETRAGEPTVTIECASREGTGERAYAWKDKLRFQLTASELQLVTCLLLGAPNELTFRNHGEKWCSIVQQPVGKYAGVIRITMGQSGAGAKTPRTVAIDFASLGPVAALCLRQCANLLRLSPDSAPIILRSVARAYAQHCSTERKAGSGAVSRQDTDGPDLAEPHQD